MRRVNRAGGLKTLPPRSLFGFNLEVAGARPPAGLAGRRGKHRCLCLAPAEFPYARPSAPPPVAAASLNRGVVFVFDPRALAAWHAAEAGASGAGPGAAEAEEDGAGVRAGPAAPWNWARSPPTAAACSSLAAPLLRRSPRGRCCLEPQLLADCPLSPTWRPPWTSWKGWAGERPASDAPGRWLLVSPRDDPAGSRVCPLGSDAPIRDGLAGPAMCTLPPRAECWAGEAVRIVQGYPLPEPDRRSGKPAGHPVLFTLFRFLFTLSLFQKSLWNLPLRGARGAGNGSF